MTPFRAPEAGAGNRPLIGAQLSTAGGFAPVPERAMAVGAEVVQVFNTNPRAWRARQPDPAELTAFTTRLKQHRLPLFLHSIYLINLSSPYDDLRAKSSQALAQALSLGCLTRAQGVVTHIGSHHGEGFAKALKWVTASVEVAVAEAMTMLQTDWARWVREDISLALEEEVPLALPALLLESGTGAGRTVGGRLEELAQLLESLRSLQAASCGLCLDTAHLFSAGYPVHTVEGVGQIVAELVELGLVAPLGLVHLNDSKTPFASGRDLHENPGQGYIGLEGLAAVVRHPVFREIPFVLEVPGEEGHGPDAFNLQLVQAMREGAPRR